MTCLNCGSAAVQPNGWCGNCGYQAAPPPAPPQSPAPQAAWPPQPPAWPTPETAPAAPPAPSWSTQPTAPQSSWSSPNASWQAAEPSVEHARFTDPMGEPSWSAAQDPAVAAPQSAWSGGQQWPTGQHQPSQPSWATDATSTFNRPEAEFQPYAPTPAMDATVVNGYPAYTQQPTPEYTQQQAPTYAEQHASSYAQQQAPTYAVPPSPDATAVQGFPPVPPAPYTPPAPQYGSAPPPYMVNPHAPATAKGGKGDIYSHSAFGLAVMAVLFMPGIFGAAAVGSAVVALIRRERRAKLALILSLAGTALGVAFTLFLREMVLN
ncbi:hypothetical protein JIG36_16475 [Actinoplanes sp. LDG1-06]|uniref:DUF4190 domain-containing protein n=1 Tax=Paractinoplanes ovalisporus TaxID=2810368 RepID=A0ABS2ABI6_9ACTN|nr:hypothetical protein [Actinoplanes ovalisporus]MBM2617150.1 hypothetical protein [Actinoplanes ovalisporus]